MSDLISRKAVMDEINSLTVTVTGLRAGKGVLNQFAEEYKKSVLRILDEAPTAYDVKEVTKKIKLKRFDKEISIRSFGGPLAYVAYCEGLNDSIKIVKGGLEE